MARRCDCRLLCRSVRLKEEIQIPARYEHCTLDAYGPQTLSQHRALRVARRFVERYPNVAGGLFIAGTPGVGKTHLAVGILLELAARYREGLLFVDFGAMLEAQAYRKAGCRSDDGRRIPGAELLVIDDFGNAPVTDANVEYVEWVLQLRWNSKGLTILTGGVPIGRSYEMALDSPPSHGEFINGQGQETGHLGRSPVFSQLVPVRSPDRRPEVSMTTRAFVRALSAPIRARLIGDNRLLLMTGNDFRREGSRADRNVRNRADVTKVA